jgi:hypothetical protein
VCFGPAISVRKQLNHIGTCLQVSIHDLQLHCHSFIRHADSVNITLVIGSSLSPLGMSTTSGPILPATDEDDNGPWNENWQGNPKYLENTCPSATLPATNTSWPDLELNLERRRITVSAIARPLRPASVFIQNFHLQKIDLNILYKISNTNN